MRASHFQAGEHLPEGALETPHPECPLCLSRGPRKAVLRLQTKPDVDLLQCACCGGCSASRMPTAAALRSYYSRYYDTASDARVTFHRAGVFARHVLGKSGLHVERARTAVLDFGGGDGKLSMAIAQAMLDRGAAAVSIALVDYNGSDRAGASERITIEHSDALAVFEGRQFDLVLASAVLEHIPFPRTELVTLLAAVRPGGVFYARTPVMAPLLRLLCGLRWRIDFTYPAHVHDLGPAFWSRMLEHVQVPGARFRLRSAGPSPVETAFRNAPLRTVAAYALKAPAYILGARYPFVGGWEVFMERTVSASVGVVRCAIAPAEGAQPK